MKRLAILLFALVLAAAPGAHSGPGEPPDRKFFSGQLLVATPALKSPVFGGTVILMLHHDASGAMGVILNRPVEKRSLGELMKNFAVAGETSRPEHQVTVHFGGPLSPEMAVVIHSSDFAHADSMKITGFASASGARLFLRALADGNGPSQSLFAAGYAGWGPGQLEGEIAEGSWVVAAPDAGIIFDRAYSTMWRRALRRRFHDL